MLVFPKLFVCLLVYFIRSNGSWSRLLVVWRFSLLYLPAHFNIITCYLMTLCPQPIDKQSLLDSGILCCLIHVLGALLGPHGGNQIQNFGINQDPSVSQINGETESAHHLEVTSFSNLLLFVSCIWTYSLLCCPSNLPILLFTFLLRWLVDWIMFLHTSHCYQIWLCTHPSGFASM